MVKKSTLAERIRDKVRNVPLKDFERLIKQVGYIEEGSKHPKAIIGKLTMPYKRENPIKACYVKELLGIIEHISKVKKYKKKEK